MMDGFSKSYVQLDGSGMAVIQELLVERATFLTVHAIGFCAFLTQWAVFAALDGPRVGI